MTIGEPVAIIEADAILLRQCSRLHCRPRLHDEIVDVGVLVRRAILRRRLFI